MAVLPLLFVGNGSRAGAQPSEAWPVCFDLPATIVGTEGDDVLFGTPGPDVIVGGDGNDVIRARGGDDFVCGGDGDDTIYGAVGADYLDGEAGDDKISGRGGADWIDGGPGQDLINGGGGDDWINGGDGDDSVFGRGGNDRLTGVDGQDRMRGGSGDDVIVGGAGADSTRGGPGSDTCEISPEEPSTACEAVTVLTYHRASVALLFGGKQNPEQLFGIETFAFGEARVFSEAFPNLPVSMRSDDTTSFEIVVPDTAGEVWYASEIPAEFSGVGGGAEFGANEPGPLDLELSLYTLVPGT